MVAGVIAVVIAFVQVFHFIISPVNTEQRFDNQDTAAGDQQDVVH